MCVFYLYIISVYLHCNLFIQCTRKILILIVLTGNGCRNKKRGWTILLVGQIENDQR